MHETNIEDIIAALIEAGAIRPEEVSDLLADIDALQQVIDLWLG